MFSSNCFLTFPSSLLLPSCLLGGNGLINNEKRQGMLLLKSSLSKTLTLNIIYLDKHE